ncbi:MAG: LysR family transcriptional regulator [Proteobacteria bacterium]|nr:LysR family transcriptional regulator [Pseudomonadota bacterium]
MEIIRIESLLSLQAFMAVAVKGNFTQAAKELKIPLAQVSKRVAKLESELKIQLFQRTTRHVSLTEEGQLLVPKIQVILDQITAIQDLFEKPNKLSGSIRITTVSFIAKKLLLPFVENIQKLHNDLKIEIDLSENLGNLVFSNFDIAVRIHQEPQDSGLIYKKLHSNNMIMVATPAYIKKNGVPESVEDLFGHQLLFLDIHQNLRIGKRFMKEFSLQRKFISNDGELLTEVAKRNHGILLRSYWDLVEDLKSKKFIRVLKNESIGSFGNIYAVVSSKRFMAPRIRMILDMLEKEAKTWSVI